MLNLRWSTGPWRKRTGFTGAKGAFFHFLEKKRSVKDPRRNGQDLSAQLTLSFKRPPVLVLMPVMQHTASYVPSPCLGVLAQQRHRRQQRRQRHGQHRHGRPRRGRRGWRRHGRWLYPRRCAPCAAPPTMRLMRHWAGRCDGLG